MILSSAGLVHEHILYTLEYDDIDMISLVWFAFLCLSTHPY
jgi:hypothetical protein